MVSLRKLATTERIIKAGPLTTTREAAKELNTDHSTDVQHVKQTGKAKRLEKLVPNELIADKKNRFEELSSFILCNNEPFLDQTVT